MKNNYASYIIGALLVCMLAAPLQARGSQWKIDAAHSTVGFGIKHIFATVRGHFSEFDASIRFDPNQLDQSSFDFTVKVDTINTANTKRDNHLRSSDFFSADEFPTMGFVSSSIVHKGGKEYVVKGTMRLKGTSQTMEIPFLFHGTAPNPLNKDQTVAGFDARFILNRLDFGVGSGKFYEMGVVNDKVRVFITIEAVQ